MVPTSRNWMSTIELFVETNFWWLVGQNNLLCDLHEYFLLVSADVIIWICNNTFFNFDQWNNCLLVIFLLETDLMQVENKFDVRYLRFLAGLSSQVALLIEASNTVRSQFEQKFFYYHHSVTEVDVGTSYEVANSNLMPIV